METDKKDKKTSVKTRPVRVKFDPKKKRFFYRSDDTRYYLPETYDRKKAVEYILRKKITNKIDLDYRALEDYYLNYKNPYNSSKSVSLNTAFELLLPRAAKNSKIKSTRLRAYRQPSTSKTQELKAKEAINELDQKQAEAKKKALEEEEKKLKMQQDELKKKNDKLNNEWGLFLQDKDAYIKALPLDDIKIIKKEADKKFKEDNADKLDAEKKLKEEKKLAAADAKRIAEANSVVGKSDKRLPKKKSNDAIKQKLLNEYDETEKKIKENMANQLASKLLEIENEKKTRLKTRKGVKQKEAIISEYFEKEKNLKNTFGENINKELDALRSKYYDNEGRLIVPEEPQEEEVVEMPNLEEEKRAKGYNSTDPQESAERTGVEINDDDDDDDLMTVFSLDTMVTTENTNNNNVNNNNNNNSRSNSRNSESIGEESSVDFGIINDSIEQHSLLARDSVSSNTDSNKENPPSRPESPGYGKKKVKILINKNIPLIKLKDQNGKDWIDFVKIFKQLGLTDKVALVKEIRAAGEKQADDKYSGLWTSDVNNLMGKDFGNYYGAIGIDELKYVKPNRRYKDGGVVINVNEHWIPLYWNQDSIQYIDPLGQEPSKEVKNEIKYFVDHVLQPDNYLKLKINKVKFQRKNGVQCGVYAATILRNLLEYKVDFPTVTHYGDSAIAKYEPIIMGIREKYNEEKKEDGSNNEKKGGCKCKFSYI